MSVRTYAPVWYKYRPAILKMMVDAGEAPQQYALSAHEFQDLNGKKKTGYAFNLTVAKGRAVNSIRDSVVAQNLLELLQNSRKGSEMIVASSYEFNLDKQFVLHVKVVPGEDQA